MSSANVEMLTDNASAEVGKLKQHQHEKMDLKQEDAKTKEELEEVDQLILFCSIDMDYDKE